MQCKKEVDEIVLQLFEKAQITQDHEKEMEKMFAKIGQGEMERDYLINLEEKLGL